MKQGTGWTGMAVAILGLVLAVGCGSSGGGSSSGGSVTNPQISLTARDTRLQMEGKTLITATVRTKDGSLTADGTTVTFGANYGELSASTAETSAGTAVVEYTAPETSPVSGASSFVDRVSAAALGAASTVEITVMVSRYRLTIRISPASSAGSVSASPSADSDGLYARNTVVTLTASAASGYTFAAWGGDASGSSSTTSVTMDQDKTVTATFQ